MLFAAVYEFAFGRRLAPPYRGRKLSRKSKNAAPMSAPICPSQGPGAGGYTQLLGQRYKGRLDGDADDFLSFAEDGAPRMRLLVQGLLAYCRVETTGKDLLETLERRSRNCRQQSKTVGRLSPTIPCRW